MILIDTNIFLEALLEQDRTPEVRSFFETIDLDNSYITDFSLHSIGVILFRLEKNELFNIFIKDLIQNGMGILSLKESELLRLNEIAKKFNLDFDDAYQYVCAKSYKLELVSFDGDFDRTDIQRKEPFKLLK
ncbi:MAG: PIN domain-containing protein [bacterium]|nr:PIN domain-containing protein [bacterium]